MKNKKITIQTRNKVIMSVLGALFGFGIIMSLWLSAWHCIPYLLGAFALYAISRCQIDEEKSVQNALRGATRYEK